MKPDTRRLSRRRFLSAAAAGTLVAGGGRFVSASGRTSPSRRKRVLVLGIDGMSPVLLRRYVAEGRMPNFARLIGRGSFRPLRSSVPPQSPVAWSNFITGMNPGKHGIYDFIHRDPATLAPYLSTSRTTPASAVVPVGSWRIPLRGGGVELLRKGPAFWKILTDHGVPCTLYRLPANFPPVQCEASTLSGLGTPDLRGAYGVATYVTDVEPPNRDEIRDADVLVVDMAAHRCEVHLLGPDNALHKERRPVRVKFTVHRDPQHPVARITIQDTQVLLNQGEWSDWVRVRFEMMPHVSHVTGICRFFLKEVHPHFKLYVSPVNIDPAAPALPISTPDGYAARLARELGPFHTQGIAEDTKSLSSGLLTDAEYLQQARSVLGEDLEAYDYCLRHFDEGLLFFYFSTIDLNSHMFWRSMDPRHPLYTPELGEQHGKTVEDLYVEMDAVLGRALNHVDDNTTLIVLSDHGFNPFCRTFSVNGWLLENGFARLRDPVQRGTQRLLANTNWDRTYAYGLGINAIYLNLRGRERDGLVNPGRQARSIVDELVKGLHEVKDPDTGQPVIARAYRKEEVYQGDAMAHAPDIVLGFHRGYRASWDTILGTYDKDLIADNTDKWSGDHCMDVNGLSGVLLANKTITTDSPALIDLAPTILAAYGIAPPPGTEGKVVLEPG